MKHIDALLGIYYFLFEGEVAERKLFFTSKVKLGGLG